MIVRNRFCPLGQYMMRYIAANDYNRATSKANGTNPFVWSMGCIVKKKTLAWWRHQMETFSALLAICAGNSPVFSEFPAQRPVAQSFCGFFICSRINGWVNNYEAGDLKRILPHFGVIVMLIRPRMVRILSFTVIWQRTRDRFTTLLSGRPILLFYCYVVFNGVLARVMLR